MVVIVLARRIGVWHRGLRSRGLNKNSSKMSSTEGVLTNANERNDGLFAQAVWKLVKTGRIFFFLPFLLLVTFSTSFPRASGQILIEIDFSALLMSWLEKADKILEWQIHHLWCIVALTTSAANIIPLGTRVGNRPREVSLLISLEHWRVQRQRQHVMLARDVIRS